MLPKSWLIIKDETARTFEVVVGISENAFSNKVIAMQRAGMTVTPVLLPVSNRHASQNHITFTGYTREAGLWNRLQLHLQKQIQQSLGEWD